MTDALAEWTCAHDRMSDAISRHDTRDQGRALMELRNLNHAALEYGRRARKAAAAEQLALIASRKAFDAKPWFWRMWRKRP